MGLIPETDELAGDSLRVQTRQVLQNIDAILQEAGLSLADVIDVQVFMTVVSPYSDSNTLYAAWFGDNPAGPYPG